MKKKMGVGVGVIVAAVILAAVWIWTYLPSSNGAVPYEEAENWAYFALGENKDVDLFLVAPTVEMGRAGNYNMSLDQAEIKANFLGALNMEQGIFSDVCRMYAPYYRQAALTVYELEEAQAEEYFAIAYNDVRDAFLYYMEYENDGRPFILAGFSQGADMCLRLMKDLFEDGAYEDQLVAVYALGWRLTEEEVEQYPQIRPATGETDTGTVICFDAETVETENTLVVPSGVKTLAINPLNWRTDATMADKSLNLGACFTNYDAEIVEEIPALCGGYLDPERGTLKVTDITPQDYPVGLEVLGEGSYHLYDYQFFFRNLQENVNVRSQAYLQAQTE